MTDFLDTTNAKKTPTGDFLDTTTSNAALAESARTRAANKVSTKISADQANVEAANANSFSGLFKETAKNIIPTISSFAKTAVTNPKEAAMQVGQGVLGGAEGVLNAIPYHGPTGEFYSQPEIDKSPVLKVQGIKAGTPKQEWKIGDLGTQLSKELWTTVAQNASKGTLTDDQAHSLYDSYLKPYETSREAGSFASMFIPYEGAEMAASKGLSYAMPKFAENYKTATKILSSVIGFNVAGQALADPNSTAEDRLRQIPLDTALGAAFPLAGALFKGASNLIFRPLKPTEFAAKEAIVEVLPNRMGAKVGPETPRAVVTTPDGKIAMSTNDVNAVRGYIKDSGKTNIVIKEQPAETLGLTREGIPITANHEFNPKTGLHTITVTNLTDAESFAHEWGHYINDDVAKQVRGLSNYLFDEAATVRNPQGIENTLRSLATKQLGEDGNKIITNDMLDRKMSTLITEIRSDIRQISATRTEPRKLTGAKQYSEKFSDAVSKVLTGESAYRNTALYKFLNQAGVVDADLVRSMRAAAKAGDMAPKEGKSPLQQARDRQQTAMEEKLGMGDQLQQRPTRPGSKFDQTTAQKDEITFAKITVKTSAPSEQGVRNVIQKQKIPGKNLVEMQIAGKKPVTLVVHEIDRDIVRALQVGAQSKYMAYVERKVMTEYGFTRKQAQSYIANRFGELKAFARAQAEEGQHVLAKAVRTPGKGSSEVAAETAGGPATEPLALKDGPAPAKTPDEVLAAQQYEVKTAAKEQAQYYTLAELELAEAGQRMPITDADGFVEKWTGVPSSFPKWIPEHLRSKDLLDKVRAMIEDGRVPADHATRQAELYEVVTKEIEERTGKYADGAVADQEQVLASQRKMLEAERNAAEEEYNNVLSTGEKDRGFSSGETMPSEAIGYGGEAETPLKVNLDRMETGKIPETEAFRAEKMTTSAQDEVFLNTKVLPEITGKMRVGRSNESIIQDAMRSDMTEEKFLTILTDRVGALTPDVRAGFNLAMDKAKGLQEMLGGRTATELSAEELSRFKEQLGQTMQLFEVYSGIRTEASNLLRSFGVAYEKGEDDVLRGIFEDLQKAGIAKEGDLFRVMSSTYQKMNESPRFKTYMKAWYAAVLSGPATSIRNIMGSLSNVMSEVASAAVTPGRMKEVPTMVAGFYQGLVEKGLPEARAAMKGELSGKFTTAYDPQFALPEDGFRRTPAGAFDRITESVGRFLNAQDIAISSGIREMEKSALKVYAPEVSDAVAKAVSEMYGLASVYRGLPKGRIMRGIVLGAETATREAPALKILIPFIRTIGNVIDRQFDYMPIFSMLRLREGTLLEQSRAIAKKYSITGEQDVKLIMQRLRDQQMGRMYLGLATAAGAAALAKQGLVSGIGPSDYNEKVQLERTGWRANSIKVGDTWVPYTYFGPLAGIFSLAGTMHDTVEYDNTPGTAMPALLGKGLIGWGQSQLNTSFLKGTADLLNVLSGDTAPSKFFTSLGTSLIPIPNLYTQTLNMSKNAYSHITGDVTLRQQYQTRNIVDAVRVKLGLQGTAFGTLKALDPRTDMFGSPMTLDFIYGVSPTRDKMDSMPVDSFLINNSVTVTTPPKGQSFSIRGKLVKLDQEQYTQYSQRSGKLIYEQLTKNLGHMKNLQGDKLQNYVDDIVTNARKKVRTQILSGN